MFLAVGFVVASAHQAACRGGPTRPPGTYATTLDLLARIANIHGFSLSREKTVVC